MNTLRTYLASELASKLQRHGVVIWDDREQSYGLVVAELAPEDTAVARFEGSWFALRRDIEALLAGPTSPNLLVYLSAPAADPDPLEELRSVGAPFRSLLPTVIRGALRGQLSDRRLEELGKQCRTLNEAEAAIDAGASEADARLMALVDESNSASIARSLLSGSYDKQLSDSSLFAAARTFFDQCFGWHSDAAEPATMRADVFRHLVMVMVHSATGALPDEFVETLPAPSVAQQRAAAETWASMRTHPDSAGAIADLAEQADRKLHIAVVLTWQPGMETVDLTAGLEEVALLEARRLLTDGLWADAGGLAETRLRSSWWAQPSRLGQHDFSIRWRAVVALAELNEALSIPIPPLPTLAAVVDWYELSGWKSDTAYRRAELLRVTAGTDLNEFDDVFVSSRKRYDDWLDAVLRTTADAITADPHISDNRQQRHIHRDTVRQQPGTAYLLVDALRYELGRDLATRLGRLTAEVDMRSAVAAVPTITHVGMAAITPGADERFDVEVGNDSRLAVQIHGQPVRTVPDRVRRFEHAHGKVADVQLDKLAQYSNRELKKRIEGAQLVVIRSTEIDADGESDQLAASWGSFDSTLDLLQTAVARLLHAGIKRVVITADHGFLAVRQVGQELKIDKPFTGTGELHRRAWIGIGGTATDSTVKVPLSDFGIGGGLDIIAPRGLGVFVAGGGLQFFHGGLSPQELVVPVITVTADEPTSEPKYAIALSVAGGKIRTGVVAVTIQMTGDLFTSESGVRVVLSHDGKRIARVIGGDGYDPATDTIDVAVDKNRVITMQISENLVAGTVATIEVHDASTGTRLGDALAVDIAAHVYVEDEL